MYATSCHIRLACVVLLQLIIKARRDPLVMRIFRDRLPLSWLLCARPSMLLPFGVRMHDTKLHGSLQCLFITMTQTNIIFFNNAVGRFSNGTNTTTATSAAMATNICLILDCTINWYINWPLPRAPQPFLWNGNIRSRNSTCSFRMVAFPFWAIHMCTHLLEMLKVVIM